jgi:GNAT superfamily N-acetyltransferase
MSLNLRKGRLEDAEGCGIICYEAFKTISEAHNFPPDFPVPEAAIGLMKMMLSREGVYSVIAESEGQVVGSNFLWEGNQIAGVGPITVNPEVQNGEIGKKLMKDVLERADEKGFLSVRLVQAAYHNRSLSLYTKLGFDTCEPLSLLQGAALNLKIEGYSVRPATENDVEACDRMCLKIHGHKRTQDILDGIAQNVAMVVEHNGEITGYSSLLGFFGHSVGESNDDLKALIGAAQIFHGAGFLLPTRNSELLRWCLKSGLRIVMPLTLMSKGLYQEPKGAFLPSILY